ncbi:hypothetical protein PR003_g27680 [Phytophthora rubi]|uniref:Uncharacterized protein n=1 Tax=Phytophthora rubi TaxID=129364 RepID=A0A6A4BZP3_9STRA|nr:hypothetical protein PR003_g27680 [Phytophthora rubi]
MTRLRQQPLGQDIQALLQGALPVDTNGSRGLPVSPGAIMGKIVFKAADDEAWFKWGKNAILARGGPWLGQAVRARPQHAAHRHANSKLMRVHTTSGTEVVLRDGDYIGYICVNGTTGEAVKARSCRRLP